MYLSVLCTPKSSLSRDFFSPFLGEMAKPIYLDWNATTPLCKRAKESMRPFLEQDDLFGNPSSAHVLGEEPRRRLETARGQLARAVNAREGTDIIFTGCGSESNALAIEQAIMGMSASKPHVVTTSIEHPAILESLKYYESIGRLEASYVDASEEGVVVGQSSIPPFPFRPCLSQEGSEREWTSGKPIHCIRLGELYRRTR